MARAKEALKVCTAMRKPVRISNIGELLNFAP